MPFRLMLLLFTLVAGPAAALDEQWHFDGWSGPALTVYSFVPERATATTPVVIVIHGWSREARRYYDDWRALGEEHGFIVVVPHFPTQDFPGSSEFNLGHVFEDGDARKRRPQETWTFAAIEALFDEVVARLGSSQADYTLFGHSAGSQFVHRFLYYMPDARWSQRRAANSSLR